MLVQHLIRHRLEGHSLPNAGAAIMCQTRSVSFASSHTSIVAPGHTVSNKDADAHERSLLQDSQSGSEEVDASLRPVLRDVPQGHSWGEQQESEGSLYQNEPILLGKRQSLLQYEYLQHFAAFGRLDGDSDGYVSGLEVRPYLLRSGLSTEDLRSIWDLADITCDGKLDAHEYALIMLLVETRRCGVEIPAQLPPDLLVWWGRTKDSLFSPACLSESPHVLEASSSAQLDFSTQHASSLLPVEPPSRMTMYTRGPSSPSSTSRRQPLPSPRQLLERSSEDGADQQTCLEEATLSRDLPSGKAREEEKNEKPGDGPGGDAETGKPGYSLFQSFEHNTDFKTGYVDQPADGSAVTNVTEDWTQFGESSDDVFSSPDIFPQAPSSAPPDLLSPRPMLAPTVPSLHAHTSNVPAVPGSLSYTLEHSKPHALSGANWLVVADSHPSDVSNSVSQSTDLFEDFISAVEPHQGSAPPLSQPTTTGTGTMVSVPQTTESLLDCFQLPPIFPPPSVPTSASQTRGVAHNEARTNSSSQNALYRDTSNPLAMPPPFASRERFHTDPGTRRPPRKSPQPPPRPRHLQAAVLEHQKAIQLDHTKKPPPPPPPRSSVSTPMGSPSPPIAQAPSPSCADSPDLLSFDDMDMSQASQQQTFRMFSKPLWMKGETPRNEKWEQVRDAMQDSVPALLGEYKLMVLGDGGTEARSDQPDKKDLKGTFAENGRQNFEAQRNRVQQNDEDEVAELKAEYDSICQEINRLQIQEKREFLQQELHALQKRQAEMQRSKTKVEEAKRRESAAAPQAAKIEQAAKKEVIRCESQSKASAAAVMLARGKEQKERGTRQAMATSAPDNRKSKASDAARKKKSEGDRAREAITGRREEQSKDMVQAGAVGKRQQNQAEERQNGKRLPQSKGSLMKAEAATLGCRQSPDVDQKGNRSDLFDGSISISLSLELSEEQVRKQIQQNVKEWLGADLIHFSLSRVCGCEAELRFCLDAQNDSAHSDAAETLAIVSQVLKHIQFPCSVTDVKRTAMTSSSGPRQAPAVRKDPSVTTEPLTRSLSLESFLSPRKDSSMFASSAGMDRIHKEVLESVKQKAKLEMSKLEVELLEVIKGMEDSSISESIEVAVASGVVTEGELMVLKQQEKRESRNQMEAEKFSENQILMKHHTSQRDSPADILPDMYTSSPASFHAPTLTTKLTLSADDFEILPVQREGESRTTSEQEGEKLGPVSTAPCLTSDSTLMSISDTKSDSPASSPWKSLMALWEDEEAQENGEEDLGVAMEKQTFPLQKISQKQENADASWGGTSSRLHTIESDLPSHQVPPNAAPLRDAKSLSPKMEHRTMEEIWSRAVFPIEGAKETFSAQSLMSMSAGLKSLICLLLPLRYRQRPCFHLMF